MKLRNKGRKRVRSMFRDLAGQGVDELYLQRVLAGQLQPKKKIKTLCEVEERQFIWN
jgi:hypothetical protein